MSNSQSLTPLRETDYDAIEAAVMETEKGRWFLAEYASRHRVSDTDEVLSAIARLEAMLKRERRPDADRIRLDIGEMKDAIERTKREISQIKSDGRGPLSRFDRASNELDAIVVQTEGATSEILGSAEKIQEICFTMREAGIDASFCDEVENLTTNIYMACSFQDLTGQRTQKVVQVLRYLENRINAMIEIWGMDDEEVSSSTGAVRPADMGDHRPDAHLLNGPALAGEGIHQTMVDDLMGEDAAADAAAIDTVADFARQSMDADRMAALAALDVDAKGPDGQIDFDAIVVDADDQLSRDADGQIDFDAIVVDADEPPAPAFALAGDDLPPEGMSAAELADSIDFDAVAVDDEAVDDEAVAVADDETAIEADAPASEEISDVELAAAEDGVDTAIEALKEVSEAARAKDAAENTADPEDPLAAMTKAERQALFS